jgi:hypothetical protein
MEIPPPTPYPGVTISVYDSAGKQLVAQTTSDGRGRFAVALQPGHYRVVAGAAPAQGQPPGPQEVQITRDTVRDVELVFVDALP